MRIELKPGLGGSRCCSQVDIDGGERFEDRGAWCRQTGKLVLDGRIVAVDCWEWADVQAWAARCEP